MSKDVKLGTRANKFLNRVELHIEKYVYLFTVDEARAFAAGVLEATNELQPPEKMN